ncbi:MAG TPA: CopG family transcriptional regulator [Acidimicrobiales bacterium]|jgi:hypothetical protein|nr:CopG family transcriptional regulator [Acidimicrobiales bacterium]
MPETYGKTPSGSEITQEFLEHAVTEAEDGYDLDEMKVRPGPGRRPEIESEAAPVQSVRLGVELTRAATERATKAGITRAELIRRAVRDYLSRTA